MQIGKLICVAFSAIMGIAMLSRDARAAIAAGQIDKFDDGTSQSWEFGHGFPAIEPGGGPAGASDSYIQMSAGTGGLALNLIIFNDNQWTGNYAAAGVTQIDMDLKNPSTVPLTMRVVLKTGNGQTPGWCSTSGFALPADGVWHHASYLLDTADMTPINSPPPLATLLTNVGDMRILDAGSPTITGDSVTAVFGVDNIQAVPEPAGALVILGVWALKLCGRRRSSLQHR
jgi:hypothetical protein